MMNRGVSKNMWYIRSPYLAHFGVLGMHWGIRRYQNKDGTLTSEGKVHYSSGEKKALKSKSMTFNDSFNEWGKSKSKNVLYLDDNSTSGDKSVVNEFVSQAKKSGNVTVVSLDNYTTKFKWTSETRNRDETREDVINRKIKDGTFDKDLVDILDRTAPGWSSLSGSRTMLNSTIPLQNGVTTKGELLNKVGDAITEYGSQKYNSGSKVIVTGSDTFRLHNEDSDFYKNNPVCVVGNRKIDKNLVDANASQVLSNTNGNTTESFYNYFNPKRKVKDL